MYISLIHIV